MRRWFHGRLVGHYSGTPSSGAQLSPAAESEHFHIHVYRALIPELTIICDEPDPEPPPSNGEATNGEAEDDWAVPESGEWEAEPSAPISSQEEAPGSLVPAESAREHHHAPRGPAHHQPCIGQVHFVDALGPGRTVRGMARDVRLSEVRLSHPARHGNKTYGRIEARCSGWFRPPPEPEEPEEVSPPPAERAIGWASDVVTHGAVANGSSGSGLSQRSVTAPGQAPLSNVPRRGAPEPGEARASPALGNSALGQGAALPLGALAGSALDGSAELSAGTTPREFPFFLLGAALTVALLFLAKPGAAVLFAFVFLPAYVLRRWLHGVVPDRSFTRLLSFLLATLPLLVAALLIARWSSVGCARLSPAPLALLMSAPFFSSLLPRSISLVTTLLAFGAVLLVAYSSLLGGICG